MKRVELTDKEVPMLAEVLRSSLTELKEERTHTDNRDYRQELKEREVFLGSLLRRLRTAR